MSGDLHAWYGESHVLHGVNMNIAQGETICILAATAWARPRPCAPSWASCASARARSNSPAATRWQPAPAPHRARGPGIVPEERGIFASLSVEETRCCPQGRRRAACRWTKSTICSRTCWSGRNSPGTKLSGGEQQMLAIARILRTGARCLLLDEPTEGLARSSSRPSARCCKAQGAGMTVVLVEQNFRFAAKVADRFYLMDHGRMTAEFRSPNLPANVMDMLHRELGV